MAAAYGDRFGGSLKAVCDIGFKKGPKRIIRELVFVSAGELASTYHRGHWEQKEREAGSGGSLLYQKD